MRRGSQYRIASVKTSLNGGGAGATREDLEVCSGTAIGNASRRQRYRRISAAGYPVFTARLNNQRAYRLAQSVNSESRCKSNRHRENTTPCGFAEPVQP